MTSPEQTLISLHYDSDDESNPLHNHEIEIDALAPILQGISGMLKEANKVINNADHQIGVRIRGGGFHEGSFAVLLQILQDPDAINVLRAIGITVSGGAVSFAGVMAIIQQLCGRKITAIKKRPNSDEYEVTVDGQVVTCTRSAKRLLTNGTFRKHVARVFSEPFSTTSADRMTFGVASQVDAEELVVEIPRAIGQAMDAPDELYETDVEETDIRAFVRFRSATTKSKEKFLVEMSGHEHKVAVLDRAFLARIDSEDASFNFGKQYSATVRKTVTRKAGTGRSSTEYTILTVHDELS